MTDLEAEYQSIKLWFKVGFHGIKIQVMNHIALKDGS
jgi:hypothetical protein